MSAQRDAAVAGGSYRAPDAPEADPSRSPGWVRGALAALSLLFVVIAWSAREPGITTGNDDARYILLARALLDGTYRDLYQVGQGWHSLYPPGYPAFLALFSALFGESYDLFIALNIALTLATFLLLFDAARRRWSLEVGLAVFVLCVLNFSVLFHVTTWVMSEGLYFALSAVALWAVARGGPARWMWLAGAAACLAALTRSIGVTLLAGMGLALLFERRWKAFAGLVVGATATVLPWLYWTFRAPAQYVGRSYAADARVGVDEGGSTWLGTMLGRVWTNGSAYATRMLPDSLPVPVVEGTVLDNVFWLGVLIGLGLVGLFSLWRRWRAVALYLVCYFGLLLVWAWNQDRFLAPVLPFFVLALAAGAFELGRRVTARRAWIPVAALAAVLSVSGGLAQARFVAHRRPCDRSVEPPTLACAPPEIGSFVAAARFARTSLPPGTAVAVGKDASFAYLSGHPVIPAAALVGQPPETFRERMREVGADYLFVGRVHGEDLQLAATLVPLCAELALVGTFEPHSYLLALPDAASPAPGSGGGGAACAPLRETAGPLLARAASQ